MTLWNSQLTGEDKLLSVLKVTRSFCKKKKRKERKEKIKRGKTDQHDRERALVSEAFDLKQTL